MRCKELSFALYCALAEQLERDGADNIPSIIDQLAGKNCGKYADMYNEYKSLKQELALYKKALELACENYIRVDGISYILRNNMTDDDYWKLTDEEVKEKTIYEILKEAKEKIDE